MRKYNRNFLSILGKKLNTNLYNDKGSVYKYWLKKYLFNNDSFYLDLINSVENIEYFNNQGFAKIEAESDILKIYNKICKNE